MHFLLNIVITRDLAYSCTRIRPFSLSLVEMPNFNPSLLTILFTSIHIGDLCQLVLSQRYNLWRTSWFHGWFKSDLIPLMLWLRIYKNKCGVRYPKNHCAKGILVLKPQQKDKNGMKTNKLHACSISTSNKLWDVQFIQKQLSTVNTMSTWAR